MDARRARPRQRVVIPITNSGYGVGEAGKYCTEETPLRPVSLYGRDKVETEEPCSDVIRTRSACGWRPCSACRRACGSICWSTTSSTGPISIGSSCCSRRTSSATTCTCATSARAFLHALDNFEAMKGEPYNVGLSDANLSKRELCERIQQQLPKFVFLESQVGKDPDQRDYIVSNEKIEAIGFRRALARRGHPRTDQGVCHDSEHPLFERVDGPDDHVSSTSGPRVSSGPPVLRAGASKPSGVARSPPMYATCCRCRGGVGWGSPTSRARDRDVGRSVCRVVGDSAEGSVTRWEGHLRRRLATIFQPRHRAGPRLCRDECRGGTR